MRVNEQWLREWVSPDVDSDKIAQQLTMAGLEVDSVEAVAGAFSKVVVGRVESTKPHPQADRLTLCQVDIGETESRAIVCGASNVRPGLKVAVALVGAKLPGGLNIKKSKLRGEPSHGMLCSEVELGLTGSAEGIMELPEDAPVGLSIREYLLLDDCVFEIDLTPNRGDCLSVRGIASEVAVANKILLNERVILEVKPHLDECIPIEIEDYRRCSQYCGRVIRGIDNRTQTPLWLSERLRRCGLRSINPVVDVTNYVMLELGQPMHAFDKQCIDGGIKVRLARANETLTLLDEKQVTLKPGTLIIADNSKPLAIAGVMGGLDSSVTEATQDIVFESACFDLSSISGVARSYGLSTDSSHRFERGVCPSLQRQAIERATELLLMIAGGQAGPVALVKNAGCLPEDKWVNLDLTRVNRKLGLNLPAEVVEDSLSRLGMKLESKSDSTWQVLVPARRFDIAIEEDLIEEVARIYGYHNIPAQSINAVSHAHPTLRVIELSEQLSHTLIARAYHEIISYSFVDPKLQSLLYLGENTLDLVNPISPELSQMRQGLWSGLLASVQHNHHRQSPDLRLFEQGLCFTYEAGQLIQQSFIGGVVSGRADVNQWNATPRDIDFYDVKGDVEALLHPYVTSRRLSFTPCDFTALHPGQAAAIKIDGHEVGRMGSLHPEIAAALDLSIPVCLFEFNLDLIPKLNPIRYVSVSKYPSIRRDLSFVLDKDISVASIEETIWTCNSEEILRKIELFDVYLGENIPQGKKSVAIGLTLQHPSRTLIESDINLFIDAILNKLGVQFGIILRD